VEEDYKLKVTTSIILNKDDALMVEEDYKLNNKRGHF